jgi:tRNA-dihydrouridine synthase 2
MTLTVEEKAHALYRGVALAPMVRASTTPLRTLALKYGADWVYTEELVDRALSATIRVENKEMGTIDYLKDVTKMSPKVQRRIAKEGGAPLLLRIDPAVEKGKLVCQIGTGEPDLALQAALHVHQDVDGIDINMGCPRKFSTSGGMGSALLTDPERACSIIKILRDNLDIPVSAKIRLLKDTASTIDFVAGLVHAGALAVAVHGRKVGDEGQHSADWETLKEVIKACKAKFPHIDFLVNGDFYTRQEWTEFMAETGASGVLLGRPALYNTSIFRKPPPSATDSDAVVTTYGYDSSLLLDKTVVVQDYLREAVKYNIHHINVKYVVGESMNNRRAPSQRSHLLLQQFPGGQTIGSTCNCHTLEDLCKVWNVDYDENVLLRSSKKAAPAQAGEHRYDDSYLLGDCKKVEHASTVEVNIDPPAKRVRVESP